jgi:hypothetical protein
MRYTLRSHDRPLGHTGVELPPPAPNMRSWQFIPLETFSDIAPIFAALPASIAESEDVIPTQGELEEIPEEERAERMRELMLGDPRMARFLALTEQLDRLELTLIDSSDVPLTTRTLGVTELEIPAAAFREVLTTIDASADLSAAREPPFYLLVAGLP